MIFIIYNKVNDDASIASPGWSRSMCMPDLGESMVSGEVSFDVTNQGLVNMTSVDIDFTLNGSNGTESYTGLDVAPGQSTTLSLPQSYDYQPNDDIDLTTTVSKVNGSDDMIDISNSSSSFIQVNDRIMEYAGTDLKGIEQSIMAELAQGKSVIIDFFASWCGPCQSSTPELNQLFVDNSDKLTVFGVTIEADDDASVVNGLGWGATYPKFEYSALNRRLYRHYAVCQGLDVQGSIPFFVMICPGSEAEGSATMSDVGFQSGMFNSYGTEATACAVSSIEDVLNIFEEIKLSPNPTSEVTHLTLDIKKSSSVNVSIFNQLGQEVRTENFGTQNGEVVLPINVSGLEFGMYSVRVNIDGEILTKQLIVK